MTMLLHLPLRCGECNQVYRAGGTHRIECPNGHWVIPSELDLLDGETLAIADGQWVILPDGTPD